MRKLKVFEAFAGYGSQSMALKNIGVNYEVVGISEIDKYAIQAYNATHPNVKNYGDISKIEARQIPKHHLFTYSFPCTDISLAGKQQGLEEGSGTRSSLLWECQKVIEHHLPKYLLMENVANLVSKKHFPHFQKWLAYLESLGYTNYWDILDAQDFNCPQRRKRIFVVSIRGRHRAYQFPKPQPLTRTVQDLLEKDIEPKYLMSEIAIYKMHRFAPKNSVDKRVVPTLTTELAHGTGKNFHPRWVQIIEDYRMPTPRECYRFMGVSDEDIDLIQATGLSNVQQYKMAGNSIVVQVLENIFYELFKNTAYLIK